MALSVRVLGILAATLLVALLLARSDVAPPALATVPGTNGKIAFITTRPAAQDYSLYAMDSDGSHLTSLVSHTYEEGAPAWSPDGRHLAYVAKPIPLHIVVGDFDGSALSNVHDLIQSQPNPPLGGQADPAWSPDGEKIAFTAATGGPGTPPGVFVTRADGAGSVIGLATGGSMPAWSPDGTTIAYVANGGSGGIWLMDAANGDNKRQLTAGVDWWPEWSPDGRQIVFSRNDPGVGFDLFVVDAAAPGSPTRLTTGGRVEYQSPRASWSADGEHIVFTAVLAHGESEIWVMGKDGSDQHPLLPATDFPTGGSSVDRWPSWQPIPQEIQVEFTQAAQTLQSTGDLGASVIANGSPPVPLVAGKPAVMRVYFPSVAQATDYNIHTTLSDYGAGVRDLDVTVLPGCSPTKRRDDVGGCTSPDIYFTPPEGQWSVSVSIGILSQHLVLYSHTFDFTSQKPDPLTIVTVGVCDSPISGNVWNCGQDSSFNPVGLLRSLAPTDRVSIVHSGTYIYRDMANSPDMTDWWYHVLLDMQALRAANPQPFQGKVVYLGIVRSDIGGGIQSIVRPGGFAGVMLRDGITVFGNPATDVTLAQVVASAVGVHFTDTDAPLTSSPPGCDGTLFDAHTDWPFADNGIQSTGFDVWQHMARKGDGTFDLMGDCWPVWISPHSYVSFLKKLGGAVPPDAPAAALSGGAWLVSGTIDGSTVSLAPLQTLDDANDTALGQGDYRIEVRGAGEAVLFTRNFSADPVVPKAPHGQPAGPGEFAESIPVQTGARRIVVLQGNNELGSVDLTGSAPTVAFDSQLAASGQQTITWTITDSDSTTFTSYLDYSRDGGTTWQEIAAGLPTTSLAVDFSQLGGSPNAKLRVRVSDGALTGEATSNPFPVNEKLPSVHIVSPEDGAILRAGQMVELEADAFDAEDGNLSGSALQWSSSLDGSLGSGESLSLTGLSAGTHAITLTAHDSANHSATDHITVSIWDAETVEGEINGDVDCDKTVTVLDALTTLLFEAGTARQQPAGCAELGSGSDPLGDVDCNNLVNGADIVADLSFVAGRTEPPPTDCRPVGS